MLLDPGALVIVLIGASAVGKSSVAERLCDSGAVEATPTWTTRPARRGEADTAYDHRFVSDADFDRQVLGGGFMDQHEFYGFRYGIPLLSQPPAGREALIVLKPIFMPKFIEHFPAVRIYRIDASPELLPDRMKQRGQSEKDIRKRMRLHAAEAAEAGRFAHVSFDNDGPLEQTVARVKARILADRAA